MLVVLVAAGGYAQAAGADFKHLSDGTVQFSGKQYPDMASYVRSAEFQQGGKRCGADHREQAQATLRATSGALAPQAKSVAHCTVALTQIQAEYYPQVLHYQVPLWFHVIHKVDGTGNISDQVIFDQVAVLNEDFRALAATMGANGVDVKVEFTLAGIDRTPNDSWFADSDASENAYKAFLAKDPNLFTNIYTNDARGYLGYAYFPHNGVAGTATDGITMLFSTIGGRNNGAFGGLYDQGRTLVHEMGHYFGLHHVFYPDDGGATSCGNTYSSGDRIVDTNAQLGQVYGCPVSSSSCGSSDPLDNYMGYVDDDCMDRFTSEQANRAVCALVNYRPNLFTEVSDDRDGDGVPNAEDAFPDDPNESVDSDGDGVGDVADVFPNDPTETLDSDGDLVGDNADVFPNDASETVDSDGDGVGDNADVFPNDPSETIDSDGDGVGDNADVFPNDASETVDSDGDGVGDNSDAFPGNPAERADSDGDGVGDNADAFPFDASETLDSDGDGVGDNADAFPNDPTESAESDGDGVGNNADDLPYDATETVDSDGDGLGNNMEAELGTDINVADTDGDGYSDGEEYNAGSDPLDASDQPIPIGLSIPLIKAIMDARSS